MVGKWHLCPTVEMNLASTRRNWPTGRGFERWYGFLGAETSQWYPGADLRQPPRGPAEVARGGLPLRRGHHRQGDRVHHGRQGGRARQAVLPLLRARRLPRAAPRAQGVDRPYEGQFDMGYEAMREETLARQKRDGHRARRHRAARRSTRSAPRETRTGPDGQPFPPLDVTRPWDSLSDDEKRLFARMAEVYAGFLSHADHQIGRLLDYLEETGQRENTMVIVVSDNGASGEGGPDGSVNEMKFMNGIPDDIDANLAMLDELGGPKTYNHYPNGWAMAFNTPFKMWKRYEFNGGTSDPCVISWPAGMQGQGRDPRAVPPRDRPGADGPRRPRRRAARDDQGPHPEPLRRREHALQLRRRRRRRASARRSSTRCSGSRGIWHDGWKAVTTHPTLSGWSHFNDDEWELYHVDVDRSELHDLAAEQPEKLRELVNLWYAEAGANDGFPLDDRSALEIFVDAAAAAVGAARPLRLLPQPRRGPRGPGGRRPRPLVRDRRPGRPPRARRPGRAVRAGLALRRPQPLRQGQPAALRQQLRRHVRAEGRRHRGPARRART